jgi:hypothetical protein
VIRQFRVEAHTGETWIVASEAHNVYPDLTDKARAARAVGWRNIAECYVEVVKERDEVALPFDEVPLRIKPPCREPAHA